MEFREEAVEFLRATGKMNAEVARELGVNDTTPANWVKAETLSCCPRPAQIPLQSDLLTTIPPGPTITKTGSHIDSMAHTAAGRSSVMHRHPTLRVASRIVATLSVLLPSRCAAGPLIILHLG